MGNISVKKENLVNIPILIFSLFSNCGDSNKLVKFNSMHK